MKRTVHSSTMLAVLIILLSTFTLNAQNRSSTSDVPRTISYQGMLSDADGTPIIDGTYPITITLYADPTGTTRVWQETYSADVKDGIFNLYLGNGNAPLPDAATMNTSLWIGTQIGDGAQMFPLTPLSASAYALNVSDNAITTGKLADGAVTKEKVDMDYIAGVEINDHLVAGAGTVLKLRSSEDITLDYDEMTNSITIASNLAQSQSDPEKGPSTLDTTDGSNNWIGRNVGTFQPTISAPVGTYNAIAGGSQTNIGSYGNFNFIGGGETNLILSGSSTVTHHSTIGGGEYNRIFEECDGCIIAGGNTNQIQATSRFSGIASGRWNILEELTASSVIAGGHTNLIKEASEYSAIGGGEENTIEAGTLHSAIAGGKSNTMDANYAAIGGGELNVVSGNYSAIPGGDHLETTGYSQTAVGFYNDSRGSLTSRPTAVALLTNNDPIFMVGNGGSGGPTARSNAFEVSYNGHSVVYQTNGATLDPILGATYRDNIIYAWGNISATAGITSEFGIVGIAHPWPGVYEIEIAVEEPGTGASLALGPNTPIAITATLVADPEDPFKCGDIRVSKMGVPGTNKFTVYTIGTPVEGECEGEDSAFMFHVTGRPAPAPNL